MNVEWLMADLMKPIRFSSPLAGQCACVQSMPISFEPSNRVEEKVLSGTLTRLRSHR